VKLRYANKVLYFRPEQTSPAEGDHVVVETERGKELGEVVSAPHDVTDAEVSSPLKPVLRVATDSDVEQIDGLMRQEAEAMPVFRELIEKYKLDMKPIAVEYLFDGSKIVFYFSAEERVDFRDLVRDLASRFKARIDMRQVGVRDEARMVGGIGHCGQMLCCVRFPGDFQPVSIRMAKEQDLPLNPLKISGLCGRLMCCLRYEYDAYKDFKGRSPKRNSKIQTPAGEGKVVELNTPRETVRVRFQDGSDIRVPVSALECSCGGGCPCSVSQEALDEAGVMMPATVSIAAKAAAEKKGAQERGSKGKGSRDKGSKEKSSEGGRSGGGRRRRGGRKRSGGGDKGKQSDGQKKQSGGQGQKSGGSGGQKKGSGSGSKSGDQKPSSSGRRRRRRRRSSGGKKPEGQGGTSGSGTPT
jgi:cell fate regulator YaaT (PSP1 superfamily)